MSDVIKIFLGFLFGGATSIVTTWLSHNNLKKRQKNQFDHEREENKKQQIKEWRDEILQCYKFIMNHITNLQVDIANIELTGKKDDDFKSILQRINTLHFKLAPYMIFTSETIERQLSKLIEKCNKFLKKSFIEEKKFIGELTKIFSPILQNLVKEIKTEIKIINSQLISSDSQHSTVLVEKLNGG